MDQVEVSLVDVRMIRLRKCFLLRTVRVPTGGRAVPSPVQGTGLGPLGEAIGTQKPSVNSSR